MGAVEIILDVTDFNCLKVASPAASKAAAAIGRAVDRYNEGFPSSGTIAVICDHEEAMDLLDYASNQCPESFHTVREALRKANFER